MAVALAFLLFERQPLNRNSRYFKRIVFVLVLVVLPLDTEVVIRKFPLLVVFAFVGEYPKVCVNLQTDVR